MRSSGACPGSSGTLAERQDSMSARLPREDRAGAGGRSGLLEGVSEGEQPRLAPWRSHERDADGKASDKTGGNGDSRVSGNRSRSRCAEQVMIAEHMIGQPGRTAAQRHDRIKPARLQRPVQRGGGQPVGRAPRSQVCLVSEVAAGRLRLLEQLLAEDTEHSRYVNPVEGYQFGRISWVAARQRAEIGIQVVLELVYQRGELGFPDLVSVGELHR